MLQVKSTWRTALLNKDGLTYVLRALLNQPAAQKLLGVPSVKTILKGRPPGLHLVPAAFLTAFG